jgi:hypothetical protein
MKFNDSSSFSLDIMTNAVYRNTIKYIIADGMPQQWPASDYDIDITYFEGKGFIITLSIGDITLRRFHLGDHWSRQIECYFEESPYMMAPNMANELIDTVRKLAKGSVEFSHDTQRWRALW